MLRRLAPWFGSTLGIALVGAVLYWAALPPLGLWPLAWIGPAFWVWLVRRDELPHERGPRPYAALWLVGFLFWLAALHWLRLPHWATSFGWVALAFYLGFYLPVFVGLSRVAVCRLRIPVIVAAPVVWTGLELARAHLLTGITMGALAHTQYRLLPLIQVSDLGGAYTVDFVVMFIAASLARMVPCNRRKWTAWPLVPAALLLAAVLGYGWVRLGGERQPPALRIALVQGSIDIEFKYDPDKQNLIHRQYCELTGEAIRRFWPLDAIVWPETMYRGTLVTCEDDAPPPDDWPDTEEQFREKASQHAQESQEALAAMGRHFGTPMVLGVDAYCYGAEGVKRFNSAAFVDSSGRLKGRYDKIHRVLFGEYVPFAGRFPWLQRLTPLPVSLDAGSRQVAFEVGGLRLAPNICYESVLPHVIRRQVTTLARAGRPPDVLVNLTNDGWFWGSSELDMHLVCGVFRAVECRKPFLIAANTGFSAWIDADGRIRAQGPRRASDVLLAEVSPDRRTSWYAGHGDLPAGFCLAVCLVLASIGLWHRGRWRRAMPESATPL
jgi:apolipoprotein N-acyltransferase